MQLARCIILPTYWLFWCSMFSAVNNCRSANSIVYSISRPSSSLASRPISPTAAATKTNTMAADSPGMTNEQEHHHHHQYLNKKMLISLIVVLSALCSIISSLFCFCIFRLKKNAQHSKMLTTRHHRSFPPVTRGGEEGGAGISISIFNSIRTTISSKKGSVSMIGYPLLEAATNNFQGNNVLGQGGHGCVYKACFHNNVLAAVKRMDAGGQDAEREFQNEVDLLSKIRHPNIISLLGYCIHWDARFVIYEMMQNGSLETHLHGPSHGSSLNWYMRMKIALDAARGLEHLHENCNPPVIHRDLKSSNILLDSNYNAKLSDFALATIYGTQNKNNIKLSGTLGSVAPEYLLDGKLTEKSDVYAFGVILLELLMGRKPVEKMTPSQCQSIVTWAMPQLTDRSKLPNIVDPVIRNTMDLKHLYQVAAVAVLCVQPEPSYRPLIMDVLHSLVSLVPLELGGTLRLTE